MATKQLMVNGVFEKGLSAESCDRILKEGGVLTLFESTGAGNSKRQTMIYDNKKGRYLAKKTVYLKNGKSESEYVETNPEETIADFLDLKD